MLIPPTSSTDYLLPEFGYNLCHELMIYGFTVTTKNQLFQMASLIITCLIWSSYYYNCVHLFSPLLGHKLFHYLGKILQILTDIGDSRF